MKRLALGLVLVVLFATSGAFAQASSKPVVGHFALGYAEPLGTAGDFVDAGWNISGGVTMHPNPQKPFGIRGDFAYNWFYASHDTLKDANSGTIVDIDDGFASMTSITIDAIWDLRKAHSIGGYFGAGIGMYSRYWQLTNTVVTGGIWCDPWTGWCYPYTTVGDAIVDNDRLTKIGYNAVLAIAFPLQSGSEIYIEAAYHRMNTDPATEYLPIVLGWRW